MRNSALVEKCAQARIVPTDDVILRGQTENHAIHFGRLSTKPGVRKFRGKYSRAGRIEIVFLENGADRFHGGIDVPPRGV